MISLKENLFRFFSIILLFSTQAGFTQAFKLIRESEHNLVTLHRTLLLCDNDSLKQIINNRFSDTLRKVISLPGSFEYPFDSLRMVGKLTSPDKRFRMYLWNIPIENGRQSYFGFIQLKKTKAREYVIHRLVDRKDSIQSPETEILNPSSWYGTLYYRIIPSSIAEGRLVYTLLGWDGYSANITQKIIEVMIVDDSGEITFGAPIFKNYLQGTNKRILFKYSATVSMLLRYEEQAISSEKRWNPKTNTFELHQVRANMIICDHLIPMDPQLEGQYQFYIPSADSHDGFVREGENWKFITGVDARNPD